jgi:hypothetical protein
VPGEHADLGGLLGSIDAWAFGENVRVDAAGLFRLINEVCSLRVDAGALAGLVDEVTASLAEATARTGPGVRLGGDGREGAGDLRRRPRPAPAL